MKTLLALILLAAIPAHAIIIETPTSLTFDLYWGQNDTRWGMPFHFDNGTRGEILESGTALIMLGHHSANPYSFMVEIHPTDRSLWSNFMVTFQGWHQDALFQIIPDAVWGTATAPAIGLAPDHLFAIEGNDHAVRVVIGALSVPEGNGPWDAAIMLTFSGALLIGMMIGKCHFHL